MTFEEFSQSITENKMPSHLSVYLQSLWFDASGDWNKAHHLVNDMSDTTACQVHAYLHRKEGDISNAGYWYSKAGISKPDINLQQEWEQLVRELLK